ncbi:MAG: LamG domain-containing protein, partial [Planctomycetes bacterium]|nr:LamG domain-containing protein [Planctomycetota bacterium]
MKKTILLPVAAIIVATCVANVCAAADKPLVDKTLVVWVSPASLTQKGGTALTIDANGIDRFDGIVFGELQPKVWMPGSNGHLRTEKNQADWPEETASPDEFVQMAIVYQGQNITVYRNGELYTKYTTDGQPFAFGPQSIVMFGPRHLAHRNDRFTGRIKDARIYDRPLDQATIAAMQPGEPVAELQPWAWWDFGKTGTYEKTGRFNEVKLGGDATIEDGCLVLGED